MGLGLKGADGGWGAYATAVVVSHVGLAGDCRNEHQVHGASLPGFGTTTLRHLFIPSISRDPG